MNINNISVQLEISFWQLAILFLDRSQVLRTLLPWLYRVSSHFNWSAHSITKVSWALAGLMTGLVIGLVSTAVL